MEHFDASGGDAAWDPRSEQAWLGPLRRLSMETRVLSLTLYTYAVA